MNYTHNGTYLGTILKRKSLEITYCIDNFNSLRYSSKCKFLYCRISNVYYQHRSLYYLKPIRIQAFYITAAKYIFYG